MRQDTAGPGGPLGRRRGGYPIDAALVEEAIALSRRHRQSLWDAGIVVAAQRAGCRELLTEDLVNGQAFGSVTVRDPFA